MPNATFEDDPLPRKVLRSLLLLQMGAMVIVIGLSILDVFSAALLISFLTLLILLAVVIWLYFRYYKIPIVREKHELEQKYLGLEAKIHAEGQLIQSTKRKRDELSQAETREIDASLKALQQTYIQNGLTNTHIRDASIPGVGPKLKERLAIHGIVNAAQVSHRISEIPGFGEAKRQALLSWRSLELARLDSTKPARLPVEQFECIKEKYASLYRSNEAAEKSAQARKHDLECEHDALTPRRQQLAPVTFAAYASKCLASSSIMAVILGFLLIGTQCISSFGATTTAMIAAIPTATNTATATYTPTITFTPTITQTATITFTPTDTLTPTITFTPQATLPPGIAACIPKNTLRETARVVGIVDGDTIDVSINKQILRVRFIGIDTPERGQAFYGQAAAQNQKLIYGKTVTLVKDRSETDQYGRLLRYVIVGDTFVNYEIVRLGYASALRYSPDVACADIFETAQSQAQSAGLGLWMPTPEPYLQPTPASAGGGSGNCDPSYPTVCIPPPPPDLDCKQIPYKRFRVLPPDPHGFDGDNDGVGCER